MTMESNAKISESPAKLAGPRALTDETDEVLAPGFVIADRYRIGDVLGAGGMGAVYVAEHVTVGRSVAVKVLAARWCRVNRVSQRFRDEARAASAAGHPNIVEVFDAGELPDGRPYLVMEYLEGRELGDVVSRRGPLEVRRACRIIRDVARAIDAAHVQGIIHRDLKAENVMLVDRGGEEIVKVLDFGIAANTAALGPRTTTPGLVMGTPVYMAPEQARGSAPTIAFDVYAIGVLLFEVLTGHTPFDGEEGVSLLLTKTDQAAPSVGKVREGLPPALVELADSCLALDPALRPSTAREVAERLMLIIECLRADDAAPAPLPLSLEDTTQRRRRIAIGVVSIAFLALGAAALALRDDGTETAPLAAVEPLESASASVPLVEESEPAQAIAGPRLGSPFGSSTSFDVTPRFASAPEPAPEPEAAPELGPEPEPGPASDEGLMTPGPSFVATKPKHAEAPARIDRDAERAVVGDSGQCSRARKGAQQARESHDWASVLRHTRSQSCWSGQTDERKRLRAKAHMELGEWGACIDATRGLDDREARQWRDLCERRKARG